MAEGQLFLPSSQEEFCAETMHMQCWFWGCDIKHPNGNLLLRNGFCRHRPPEGSEGSSCYFKNLPDEKRLLLWGFGLALIDIHSSGIYVNRYKFRPIAIQLPEDNSIPYRPEHLNAATDENQEDWSRSILLLADAVSWIVSYEKWISVELGNGYRRVCQRAFQSESLIWKTNPLWAWNKVDTLLSGLTSPQES